jgi:hypothetical protein
MSPRSKNALALGVVLILVGLVLALIEFSPGFDVLFTEVMGWELALVFGGALALVFGWLNNVPELVILGVTGLGLGGLQFYFGSIGELVPWKYAWTVVPFLVGVGILVASVVTPTSRYRRVAGANLTMAGLVLFVVFSVIFGDFRWARYWPLALIALGMVLVVRSLLSVKRDPPAD